MLQLSFAFSSVGEPAFRAAPQFSEANSPVIAREFFEFREPNLEQRSHSREIAALPVMKRSSELDESLKERFLRFRGAQPDFFPGFVGSEKLSGVEELNSSFELFEFVGA